MTNPGTYTCGNCKRFVKINEDGNGICPMQRNGMINRLDFDDCEYCKMFDPKLDGLPLQPEGCISWLKYSETSKPIYGGYILVRFDCKNNRGEVYDYYTVIKTPYNGIIKSRKETLPYDEVVELIPSHYVYINSPQPNNKKTK